MSVISSEKAIGELRNTKEVKVMRVMLGSVSNGKLKLISV